MFYSSFLFPAKQTTQAPSVSLPPSAPVPPPVQCGGGGLLCSVETPISRTSRPAEGHSQSFGVRTEEGWVGQEQLREWRRWTLSWTQEFSHNNHTFLTATAVCIFPLFAPHSVGKKVAQDSAKGQVFLADCHSILWPISERSICH